MIVYLKFNGKRNDLSSFDYHTSLLNTKAEYSELISYGPAKMLSQF